MNNDKIKFKIFNINKRYLNKKIIKMAEVLFIHAGVPINVQCKFNDKMKDIIKKLKEKVKIRSGNIYYLYNGAILNNEEFTFEQIANQVDKNRKKMSITIIEDTSDIKKKEIIKSKKM